MGRCYEFGVSVLDGCEHAMVVAAEGGRCECPECATSCPGRFRGCAEVVAKPGYVPVAAPTAARPPAPPVHRARGQLAAMDPVEEAAPETGGDAASPTADTVEVVGEPRHFAPDAVDPDLAEIRSLLEAMLDRPDRAVSAIRLLNAELAQRDMDLTEAFVRMTRAYDHLADEVHADREARDALVAAVERLSVKVEVMEHMRGLPWSEGHEA